MARKATLGSLVAKDQIQYSPTQLMRGLFGAKLSLT